MTKPSPWIGTPSPHVDTLVNSGTYTSQGATIPVGLLDLDHNLGGPPIVFYFYDGGFASGLDLWSWGTNDGDVVLNFIGPAIGLHSFTDWSVTTVKTGVLDVNVIGNTTFQHDGTMQTDPMVGSATLNLSVSGVQTSAHPPSAVFNNYGLMDAEWSPYAPRSLSEINVTLGTLSVFNNYGTVEADGTGGSYTSSTVFNVWAAPPNSPNGVPSQPFLSAFNNSGHVVVKGSGAIALFTAPVVGTGSMEVDTGARIKFSGPVSAGQTVTVTAGSLEFGPKGSITNPAMQFLGTIVGENPAVGFNLDGSYGVRDTFTVLSTAGAGLGELRVYDPYNTQVADLKLAGHFQAADFSLTPHLGSTPTDNWTAVTFSDHANTPWVVHS